MVRLNALDSGADVFVTKPFSPEALLRQVEATLRIHPMELTARDLAAMCGCSARHFIHLFHQHFGTSLRISRQQGTLKLPLVRKLRRGYDRSASQAVLNQSSATSFSL